MPSTLIQRLRRGALGATAARARGLGISGLAFCVLAVVLRARFARWGMPYIFHPDEPFNLTIVQEMVRNCDLNPHFFNYPSLMFYLNAPLQLLVRVASGELLPFEMQSGGNGIAPQPIAFVLARLTTMLFGVATLPVLLRWAKVLQLGFAARAFLALAFCVCPMLLLHATLVTPDIICAFFATCTLRYATAISVDGARRSYVLAGLCAGLAASSKYNAGLVALSIPLAHVLHYGVRTEGLRSLMLAVLTSMAALLATSPFLLLDPTAYEGILAEIAHYRDGHVGATGNVFGMNVLWFRANTGWAPLFALAVVRPARLRLTLPALAFVAAYFAFLCLQNVRFDRNLIPLYPAVLLLSAAGVDELVRALQSLAVPRRVASALVFIAACFSFVQPASESFEAWRTYERDPSKPARKWVNKQLTRNPREVIGVEAYVPYVDGKNRTIRGFSFAAVVPIGALNSLSHVVISRAGSGRYRGMEGHPGQLQLLGLYERACAEEHFPEDSDNPDLTILHFVCE